MPNIRDAHWTNGGGLPINDKNLQYFEDHLMPDDDHTQIATNKSTISANKHAYISKTLAVADVVSNTDGLSSIYPYKYDLAVSGLTASYYARSAPQAEADVSAFVSCCDGSTQTLSGSVRLYFISKPTSSLNLTIEYWLGNEVTA